MNRILATAVSIIFLTLTSCGLIHVPIGDLHVKATLEVPANTSSEVIQETIEAINLRLIDHGIAEKDIQTTVNDNVIIYDIQNADDEDIIHRMIQNQAKLELWPLLNPEDTPTVFTQLSELIASLQTPTEIESPLIETDSIEEDLLFLDEQYTEFENVEIETPANPLLVLPYGKGNYSAYCQIRDTALVNKAIAQLIDSKPIKTSFKYRWEFEPKEENKLQLYLLEPTPLLAGAFIATSSTTVDPMSGQPIISFQMKEKATAIWATYTKKAHLRDSRVAIVLDDRVYSAPGVASPILNGACQISGNFTENEALDLSHILSYPLPCPVKLVDIQSHK